MTPEEAAAAWLALLNRETDDHSALADDIVIHYFPDGAGGRREECVGLDEAMTWIQRPPKGNYRFSIERAMEGHPAPRLPVGDLSTHARYKVELTIAKWSNTGFWNLHSLGPKLIAVYHEPDVLSPDSKVELDLPKPSDD